MRRLTSRPKPWPRPASTLRLAWRATGAMKHQPLTTPTMSNRAPRLATSQPVTPGSVAIEPSSMCASRTRETRVRPPRPEALRQLVRPPGGAPWTESSRCVQPGAWISPTGGGVWPLLGQQYAGHFFGAPGSLTIAFAGSHNRVFHQEVPLTGKPGLIVHASFACDVLYDATNASGHG